MDKKISNLEEVILLDGNDVLPIVNQGVTKKVTITKIKDGLATVTYVDQKDDLKVDKVAGKELSTNDFTNILKTKLDGIQDGAEVNINADWNATTGDAQILNKPTIPSISGLATVTYVDTQAFLKVDKVAGKELSSNNYTQADKNKLAGIQDGAEVNINADWNAISGDAQILNKPTIPSISGLATTTYVDTQDNLKVDKVSGKALSTNDFTNTLKTKLDGIETGAEVNVNADWNAITGDAQILNKPIIPSAITQTSQLINNGEDGVNPFITALDIPINAQAGSLVREVKNVTGATLVKGTVVYISGSNGNKALVSKALAISDALSSRTFGLLQSDILNNGLGNCIVIGDLTGVDTSTFVEGDQLYLSGVTAGTYTNTKILAPTHLVYVGKVTRAHPTLGQIEVGIQNGYELEEIHDVSITSETNEDFLQYESATQLWKNKQLTDALIKSKLGITTLSGSNTGDNATNTQYSGLATSKQNTLISTTNIKTINGINILGSGDLPTFTTGYAQYLQTITWIANTPPSGVQQHYYKWTKVGNLVTMNVWLDYTINGVETLEVNIPFPSGAPIPTRPLIAQNNGHILNYGSGTIVPGREAINPSPGLCCLRLLDEIANTYVLSTKRDAGVNGQFVYMTISYFTN